jgi:hypothetical protein
MTTAPTPQRQYWFVVIMICGSDQATLDTINLDASVQAYKFAVIDALTTYSTMWFTVNGEGKNKITGIEDENEIQAVRNQMDKIFDEGAFWITK